MVVDAEPGPARKLVQAATGKAKFESPLHYPNPPTYGADYQGTIPILVNMANEGPFNLAQTGSDYNTVYSRVISGHSRPTGGHDFEGAAVAGVTEFPEVDSWLGAHLIPGGAFYKFEEDYPPANDRFFQLLKAQQVEQDRKKRGRKKTHDRLRRGYPEPIRSVGQKKLKAPGFSRRSGLRQPCARQ